MADIKTINVNGTSYNINLPDDSTVNDLTVTGTLTAPNISGTTITATNINTTSFKLSSQVTSYDLNIGSDSSNVPTVYGAYLNCLLENNLNISVPQINISSQSINCAGAKITAASISTTSLINTPNLYCSNNISCTSINNFTPWETAFQENLRKVVFSSSSTTLKTLTSLGVIGGSFRLLLLYLGNSSLGEFIALPPVIVAVNNADTAPDGAHTYNYYTVATLTPQLVGGTGNMTYFIHVRIQNSGDNNLLKASLFITKEWGDGSEFSAFKSDMGWSSVYLYYKIL